MKHRVLVQMMRNVLATRRSKRRDLIELAVAFGLILIVIWTPRPWQGYFWVITAATVLSLIAASFDGFHALGLRTRNLVQSLWVVGAALLCAGCAVLAAARLHTLHGPTQLRPLVQSYWPYVLSSMLQQLLLQGFFLARLTRLIPRPHYAVLAAAALFAVAHLPNPILTVLTMVWGSLACYLFMQYRNLYTLAVAHAILGITISLAIPGPMIRNMRVGLGYLLYTHHAKPPVHRNHSDQIASTVA